MSEQTMQTWQLLQVGVYITICDFWRTELWIPSIPGCKIMIPDYRNERNSPVIPVIPGAYIPPSCDHGTYTVSQLNNQLSHKNPFLVNFH